MYVYVCAHVCMYISHIFAAENEYTRFLCKYAHCDTHQDYFIMQEPKQQMETDFHLYLKVIPQISYLHQHPFWSSLSWECWPSSFPLPFYMLIWFLICEKKSVALHWFLSPDSGQTLWRVWHPERFISRRDRDKHVLLLWLRFWVPGHLPPVSQNTYNSSGLSAALTTRNTDNTPSLL